MLRKDLLYRIPRQALLRIIYIVDTKREQISSDSKTQGNLRAKEKENQTNVCPTLATGRIGVAAFRDSRP